MKKILPYLWAVVGVALGFALGLGYAWVIQPAKFSGAEPTSLQPVYRGEYILLIATSYEATGNLESARARLALFPELNADSLSSLAQQVVAAGGPQDAARGLARLSVALREQSESPSAEVALAASKTTPILRMTGTPESTLALTIPFLPTIARTPTFLFTPTTNPEFVLVSKQQVCNPLIVPPLIEVIVKTADGRGVPGVRLRVQWEGGDDGFVTGMKPEISPGYADYAVTPGKVYQITVGDGMTIVRDFKRADLRGGHAHPRRTNAGDRRRRRALHRFLEAGVRDALTPMLKNSFLTAKPQSPPSVVGPRERKEQYGNNY